MKKLLKGFIHDDFKKSIRRTLNFVRSIKGVRLDAPVAQIYICDGEMDSVIGINNFFSFLNPGLDIQVSVELSFFSSSGEKLFVEKFLLRKDAGLSIVVSEIFKKHNTKSNYGMVSLQMRPKSWKHRINLRQMGRASAHFFIFYKARSGSIGHVHPSNILRPTEELGEPWISNQLITTQGLRGICLYQLNPTKRRCEVEHFLVANVDNLLDPGKNPISSVKSSLMGYEVKRIWLDGGWDKLDLAGRNLLMGVRPLPGANSKPLLFRYYDGGQFSMSHS
jgi:hypothetical protein